MHGYSFWIGLLIPFGVIYIMNWIIFVLIFGSLLRGLNIPKETGNSENLRKLKKYFMIALGLSLLFGMGWVVGLLASSDLPSAVRYPAEWTFTLATSFQGVYLFVLKILRSAEARKFWKSCFLCQHKRKRVVSFSSSNTQTMSRLRSFSSTLASWRGTLTAGRSSTEIASAQRKNHAHLQPINLELVEKMKPDDWCYSDVFSPEPLTIPPGNAQESVMVTKESSHLRSTFFTSSSRKVTLSSTNHEDLQPINLELVVKMKPDDWRYSDIFSPDPLTIPQSSTEVMVMETRDRGSGQSTTVAESLFSVTEQPTDTLGSDECTWFSNKVLASQQSQANTFTVAASVNAPSSQSVPSLSGTGNECYVVENLQTEEIESDIITP